MEVGIQLRFLATLSDGNNPKHPLDKMLCRLQSCSKCSCKDTNPSIPMGSQI